MPANGRGNLVVDRRARRLGNGQASPSIAAAALEAADRVGADASVRAWLRQLCGGASASGSGDPGNRDRGSGDPGKVSRTLGRRRQKRRPAMESGRTGPV